MVKTKLLFLLLIICSTKTTCMNPGYIDNLLNNFVDDILSEKFCTVKSVPVLYSIFNEKITIYNTDHFQNNHKDAIEFISQQSNSRTYFSELIIKKIGDGDSQSLILSFSAWYQCLFITTQS